MDIARHASDTVTTAEDTTTTYAANTGERLRGYFTAPATGNYYFWIAASNAAELWISNDAEPVNKVRRATVTGTGNLAAEHGTPRRTRNRQWLSLVAGKKYYIEALHNTGASGAGNHLSRRLVPRSHRQHRQPDRERLPARRRHRRRHLPSHVLSPWDNPPTTTIPGTLYVTNLQGVDGLSGITATGGAFLRVNGTTAVLQLNYTGLTSGSHLPENL